MPFQKKNKHVSNHEANIELWKAAWEAVIVYGKAAAAAQLPLAEKRRTDIYVRKQAHRFSMLIRKAQKAILKRDKTPPFVVFDEPEDDEDDGEE
jgi:hypothetical protein